MSDEHGHDHPHDGMVGDETAEDALRVEALQALLVEKGILTGDDVRSELENVDGLGNPALGARIVARAWVDPAFKARLLSDAKSAVAELGIDTSAVKNLVVVENTKQVHHLVVCTLCSCYPRPILGLPPDWYKSLSYRSRAVSQPRSVLREFGLELPLDVELRVLDSTADMRYLVLPVRPDGTEKLSEEELASLVSRDSMIGVTNPRTPAAV